MLIVFVLLSVLVYLFLLTKSREFGFLDLHNDQHMYLVMASLWLLFIAYFFNFFFLNWQKASVKKIFFLACVFRLTFLFVPYLSSNDLYSYIFATRIKPLFRENPYLVAYNNFPQDMLSGELKTI